MVLPLRMKLSPLRETEQIRGDKSMALFSQKRVRNYDDDHNQFYIERYARNVPYPSTNTGTRESHLIAFPDVS